MDWEPGKREIFDIIGSSRQFEWMEEPHASPDGEKVAAVVKLEEGFDVCVNGELWGEVYQRVWGLRYLSDGRLVAFVCQDDEWTLAVDGEPWPETYGFIWGLLYNGQDIGVCVQQDMEYGIAVNGELWPQLFENANNCILASNRAKSAAVVQTRSIPQADIFTYQEGCYSVAIDGTPWDRNFVNVWTPVFDPSSEKVAAQVRLSLYDYAIVVDGSVIGETCQMVWEPCFHPANGSVLAPYRSGGKWGLMLDGKVFWKPRFFQCWHQQYAPQGDNVYAIVSPSFGRWTVAKNDAPWTCSVGGMVDELAISPDGKRAAAVCRDKNQYALMADNMVWVGWYDMAYKPVFSADSAHVAARVERAGKRFSMVMDGHAGHHEYDMLWDPVFSPDGSKILVRGINDGKYHRIVQSVDEV